MQRRTSGRSYTTSARATSAVLYTLFPLSVFFERLFTNMDVKLMRPGVKAPKYAHSGDAAIDLQACLREAITMEPLSDTVMIPSGIAVNIPEGRFGLLCSRSGLGCHGMNVATGVSVIDSNYTGEILIPIRNTSSKTTFVVKNGDRIAQLVILPYLHVDINLVQSLQSNENRGDKGFGSSGVQ